MTGMPKNNTQKQKQNKKEKKKKKKKRKKIYRFTTIYCSNIYHLHNVGVFVNNPSPAVFHIQLL
jgi:uncharacterized Rmd1/YagE family protein